MGYGQGRYDEECKIEIGEYSYDEEAPSFPNDASPVPPYVAPSSVQHVVPAAKFETHSLRESESKQTAHRISSADEVMSNDGPSEPSGYGFGVPKLDSMDDSTEEDQEGPLPLDEHDIGSIEDIKAFQNDHIDYPGDNGIFPNVSRYELVVVAVIAILVASAIVATATSIAVIRNNDRASNGDGAVVPQVEAAPMSSSSRTLSPQEQFQMIRSTLSRNPVTYNYTLEIPYEMESLEKGAHEDITTAPSVRALSWLIFVDNQDSENELVSRFALAMLYYSMGGEGWTNSDGWLSNQKICSDFEGKGNWYGITCSHRLDPGILHVSELELSDNNLSDELSKSLCLLQSLQSLWMDRNKISGLIDPDLFPSMPNLQFLYVQHNHLVGPIPNTFLKNDNNLRKYKLLVCGGMNQVASVLTHSFGFRNVLYSRQQLYWIIPGRVLPCMCNVPLTPVGIRLGLSCQRLCDFELLRSRNELSLKYFRIKLPEKFR